MCSQDKLKPTLASANELVFNDLNLGEGLDFEIHASIVNKQPMLVRVICRSELLLLFSPRDIATAVQVPCKEKPRMVIQ